MKAITLWQPWATLIVLGEKKFETRTWAASVKLIGETIACHAAKKILMPADLYGISIDGNHAIEAISAALKRHGLEWEKLPTGAVLGDFILGNIWKSECRLPVHERYGLKLWNSDILVEEPLVLPKEQEHFGDFTPGRYAWELKDAMDYDEPIPAKGMQGFWNWES